MSSGLGESFDRAQRAYDAMVPDDDEGCELDCEYCEGEGCDECEMSGTVENHKWKRLPGEAKDGTTFARCIRCGKVEES